MRLIDGIVVMVYLVFMAYIGWNLRARVRDLRDFVAGEGKLPFSVTLATLVATLIGAGLTMGQAGKAISAGAALIGGQMGWYLATLIFVVLAHRFKKSRCVSIPEMLGLRFGASTRFLGSVLVFIYCVLLLGLQIAAIGRLLGYLGAPFGISPLLGTVVATAVVIFYTTLAGLLGVAFTDLVQFIIMMVGVVAVLPFFSVRYAGGLAAVMRFAAEKQISLWNPFGGSAAAIATLMVIFALDVFVEPPPWQRMAGAKDVPTLRRAFLWSIPAIAIYAYGVVISGVAGGMLFPELKAVYGSTEAVIPALAIQLMPPVVAGLIIAALLAAIMSSLDSYLLLGSGTLVNDIVKYATPGLSQGALLSLAKWSTAAIGVLALIASLFFGSLWDMLIFAFTVYPAATAPALCAAWFWRKATAPGAFSSMLVGFIVTFYLCSANIAVLGLDPVFPGVLTSTLVLVVVSLATYRPDRATPLIGEEQSR